MIGGGIYMQLMMTSIYGVRSTEYEYTGWVWEREMSWAEEHEHSRHTIVDITTTARMSTSSAASRRSANKFQ